ncbi:MAG: hypothetical protein ACP5PW_07295 [Candidatus Dormibacteria bacterium]
MTHLLRHPLSLVLVVLVALFVIFFVVLPALSLIIHVVIALAIIWTVLSLFRFHRNHKRRDQALRKA